MIDEKYHVVKASRSFSDVGYSGPALNSTSFCGMNNASFDRLETAVQCAQELNVVNPVGFEVYHWGRRVWPVRKNEESNVELKAQQFAQWVQAAAKAHEESFDKEASNKAQAACDEKWEREKAEGSPHYYLNAVDHKQFYRMDMRQATASVVPAEFVEPVYLLLQLAWNDINDWAKENAEV